MNDKYPEERLKAQIDKYEHELSTLEHIRDYVQMKIDIALQKIERCKDRLKQLKDDDSG